MDEKYLQKYSVHADVPQNPILVSKLFLPYYSDLPDYVFVILLSMVMLLLSTLGVIGFLIFGTN